MFADIFRQHPKLKTLSIETWAAYESTAREIGNWVRNGSVDDGRGEDQCIDFGVIEVRVPPANAVKVFLRDARFLWGFRVVKDFLTELSVERIFAKYEDFRYYLRSEQSLEGTGYHARVEHVHLRGALWIVAFDLGRGVTVGKLPHDLEDKIVDEFCLRAYRYADDRHRREWDDLVEAMLADTRLLGLNVVDHGEHIVKLASSVLRSPI